MPFDCSSSYSLLFYYLYTRMQSIQFKVVIHTPAVSHAESFIYTAAEHPVQSSHYSHASRFSCRKVLYNVLCIRQPFLMPKGLYTRLQSIQFKVVIHTPVVSNSESFIYTAAVNPAEKLFSRQLLLSKPMVTCFLES